MRTILLLLGLLALVGGGCSRAPEQSPVDPEISSAITAFNASAGVLESSFQTLHEQIRDHPSEVALAAVQNLESPDETVRFAAIYALANTAESADQLEALIQILQSPNVGERLLAAEALLARGEKEAIPVAIAALNSDEELIHSLPPKQAWETAQGLLLFYTLEDFGLDDADSLDTVSVTQPAWQAWWDQVQADLEWVSDEGVYR